MRRKVPSNGSGRAAVGRDESGKGGDPSAANTPVAELMNVDVPCVGEDMSADSLAEFLLDRELIGAPVIGEDGKLSGFVSLFDLEREHFQRGDTAEEVPLKARSRGYAYELGAGYHADPIAHATVREVMNPAVLSVLDSTPVATAAGVMAFDNLEALPVVSEMGYVVGVLFATDLVRWLARQNGFLMPEGRIRGRRPLLRT